MADIFDDIVGNKDVFDEVLSESNQKSNMPNDLVGGLVGTAMTGAGIYGAVKAGQGIGKWWTKPQRMVAGVETELKNIQSLKPGYQDTDIADLPKIIGQDITTLQMLNKMEVDNINLQTAKAQTLLKQQLKTFDDTILNSTLENLSSIIKQEYPNFLNSTYNSYRKGLEGIENMMHDVDISELDFDKNVIATTLEKSITDGVPEQRLEVLKEYLGSKKVPQKITGEILPEKKFKFIKAKNFVSQIRETLPTSSQRLLTENMGKFLENYAPKGVATQLKLLNSDYSEFSEARSALRKFVDPKTGEFRTKEVSDYFLKYAKKKVDIGTENLMNLMEQGNELVKPMRQVQKQFLRLRDAKARREFLQQLPSKLDIYSKEKLIANAQKIQDQVSSLLQWKNKATQLVSERGAIIEKYGIVRSQGVKKLAKSVGTGLAVKGIGRAIYPTLGVLPDVIGALRFAQNPLGYIAETESGIPMEDLEAAKEAFNKRPEDMTDDDIQLLNRLGVLQ